MRATTLALPRLAVLSSISTGLAALPPWPDPALISGPIALDPEHGILVHQETIEIRCLNFASKGQCSLNARWTLRGQGATPLLIGLGYASEVQLIAENSEQAMKVTTSRPRSEALAQRLSELDQAQHRDTPWHAARFRHSHRVSWFEVTPQLKPNHDFVLQVRATLSPPRWRPQGEIPVVEARHPWLNQVDGEKRWVIDLVPTPMASRSQDYRLSFSLSYPSDWQLRAGQHHGEPAERSQSRQDLRVTTTRHEDVAIATLDTPANRAPRISLALGHQGGDVHLGGLLIGAGYRLRDSMRLRIGYEFAAPEWLAYVLYVETNLNDNVTVVPLVQATSPSSAGFPVAFVLGLGPSITLVPEFSPALRLEGTVQIFIVGLTVALDLVFPRGELHTGVTFLGSLSF